MRERLTKESASRGPKSRSSAERRRDNLPLGAPPHAIGRDIVSFAPEYRGYSYIVLEDETICIVDDRTYLIVDVIPPGSRAR